MWQTTSPRRIAQLIITLIALTLLGVSAAHAGGWNTLTLDSTGDVGHDTSLAVVNGNPAISYLDNTNSSLKYVRAINGNGSAWDNPITVDNSGFVGCFSSLTVVNGNPAIGYMDCTEGDLKFVRALDADGSNWDAPVILDSDGFVGMYLSLEIVDGYPAISYFDYTNSALKYVRALDATGSNWGTPITLDNDGILGFYASLETVNGYPAVSYWDGPNGDLKYISALDASGIVWGNPVIVDGIDNVGEDCSLAVVNGYPAISYYDATNYALKYVRAADENGSTWTTPVTVDNSTADSGNRSSLTVVNGFPSISYYSYSDGDLRYVQATDANGASWGELLTLDSNGDVGRDTSLAVVNGQPAISYYDFSNQDLKFTYYLVAPEIIVLGNNIEIAAGDTTPSSNDFTDFSNVTLGQTHTHTYTIANQGELDINISSLGLSGNSAGDFSIAGITFPLTITPGNSETFQVQFTPSSANTRTATLSIANNDPDENPYEFAIQGTGANIAPESHAGIDQVVATGSDVILDGTSSYDSDSHTPITYAWVQTGGPEVILNHPDSAKPTFTAPDSPAVLTFRLTVTDAYGLADSTPDDVIITAKAYTYLPIIWRR